MTWAQKQGEAIEKINVNFDIITRQTRISVSSSAPLQLPILYEKRGEAIAKKKHPSESRSQPGWYLPFWSPCLNTAPKVEVRGAQISSWILKMIAQARTNQEPMQSQFKTIIYFDQMRQCILTSNSRSTIWKKKGKDGGSAKKIYYFRIFRQNFHQRLATETKTWRKKTPPHSETREQPLAPDDKETEKKLVQT